MNTGEWSKEGIERKEGPKSSKEIRGERKEVRGEGLERGESGDKRGDIQSDGEKRREG